MKMKNFKPQHFQWRVEGGVAIVSLSRPERKNPITFESYAELRDTFRQLADADDIKAVVFASNGAISVPAATCTTSSARCSRRDMKGLLAFTRMTGDLVKAMRACPQPVIAGSRRCVRRRRRDDRAGVRPAAWHAEAQDRVSVHPRRTRRLRHGRLRACCRASSGRAARRNCSTPGAR